MDTSLAGPLLSPLHLVVFLSEDGIGELRVDVVGSCDGRAFSLWLPSFVVQLLTLLLLTSCLLSVGKERAEPTTLGNSCPQQCSGHGACLENGHCDCDEGYFSDDCSIGKLTHAAVTWPG